MLGAYSDMSFVSSLAEVQYCLVWCEVFWLHLPVMTDGVVFSPIVGQIGFTGSPEEAKLVLVDTLVSEPVESHVHGFCSFWLTTTVDDTFGRAVVSLNRCRGLNTTQFLQHVVYFNSFTCVDV